MPPRKPTTPKAPRRRQGCDGEPTTPRRRRAAKKSPDGILVTGAGGLVGRALVARLRQDGRRLVTLSRRPPSSPSLPGEVHLVGDVCSSEWERWCEGCSAAIHLVGSARPAPAAANLVRLHVTATARIIEACRNLGIQRLLTVSATGAASEAETVFLRTKFTGERLVESSGLAWTVIRPTVVFGGDDSFTTGLAQLARLLPAFPIPGDGNAIFQPIAAEDLADAIAALVGNNASVARTVSLGGLESLSLNEVARRIVHATGRRRPLVHLPLRFAAATFRLASRRVGTWLTDDAVRLLLSGSVATPLPADLELPAPSRRFADLAWLAGHATGGRERRDQSSAPG